MAIEVTSVSDRQAKLSLRKSKGERTRRSRLASFLQHGFLPRVVVATSILIVGLVAHTVFRSYRYYARIIDDRLAQGYLTSRPGLYAAPATLRPRQALSPDDLILKLRRAGYVEAEGSQVWSGSFKRTNDGVEVLSTLSHGSDLNVSPVLVTFDAKDRIKELLQDGMQLDSLTLEPEVLTNDVSTKTGQRRTLTYEQLPTQLVHAILAIEDQRFFQHPGLDPFGVARALLRNAGDDRLGQGGSTITQQLVKNTYLSSERTFRRKYAEAMLAFALERRLSKQDIFALYCNEVYLGQRGAVAVRGVEQAAEMYFGKDAGKLSLSEAATIAGMIQGPARYSPVRHVDAARERRNLVLDAMLREGWIAEEDAKQAKNENIATIANPVQGSLAPYFVDQVNRVVEERLATGSEAQKVSTTIDLDLQQLAENALQRQLAKLGSGKKSGEAKPQAALVALDPHTGAVLAMVGGSDYATSQLNRATDAYRQPGSTFKPFVYAAALEDGISPVEMFADAPQEFVYDRNRIYRPVNFGGSYSMREVPMRNGLVRSLNTVTVALALRTGLARIANLAQKFGLPRPERYPALALGTSEVTPLQLAAAYATFVNGGRHIEPTVLANDNRSSADQNAESGEQVISATTAYMVTNILSAVVDHGTARAARNAVKGTAIAGKTGTSRDGWFVGYTPNLVCVVWIGYDDNKQLGITGAEAALPVWADFMKAAIARRPELGGENFDCPAGIKFVEIDNETGQLSTLSCSNRELIAVTENLSPHAQCYLHSSLPLQYDETTPLTNDGARRSRAPAPEFVSDAKTSVATRVDVDSKGRRTLVNVMR